MSAALLFLNAARRNLLRNTRRTLAVLATVACGTGILYVYHGFHTGIRNAYRENAAHAFSRVVGRPGFVTPDDQVILMAEALRSL